VVDKAQAVAEVIGSRRSVRRFKPDPIPDEVINKILWAGTRAPTAGGREQWLFIVVKDSGVRSVIHKLLTEAHIKYATDVIKLPPEKVMRWRRNMEEGMYMAPLYVAAYLDLRRYAFSNEYRDFEMVSAIQSISAAIENMVLMAWSYGVGSVWLGVPLLLESKFNEVLNPPKDTKLVALIAFGYPDEEPRVRPRRGLNEVVITI